MNSKNIYSLLFLILLLTGCAGNSYVQSIGMSEPVVLTLDHVFFDKKTGEIIEYDANYQSIIIPNNFDGVAVTSIGKSAFRERGLTNIIWVTCF